jgi:hypothetical protein
MEDKRRVHTRFCAGCKGKGGIRISHNLVKVRSNWNECLKDEGMQSFCSPEAKVLPNFIFGMGLGRNKRQKKRKKPKR